MTELVNLTINDRPVSVPKGTLVVDAAEKLNIEIPVFCSHPKLDPVACCRMCLVEISGPRGPMLQTACSVPVAEGMAVRTDTPQVKATQKPIWRLSCSTTHWTVQSVIRAASVHYKIRPCVLVLALVSWWKPSGPRRNII